MEVSPAFLSGTSVQGYDSYGPISQESSHILTIPPLNGTGNKRKLSEDEANDRPCTRPRMADQSDVQQQKKMPPGPDHATGIVYDPRMRYHVNANLATGTLHPEDPRRIAKIMHALESEDLVYAPRLGGIATQYPRRIDARDVTDEEVLRVHTAEHLALVGSLRKMEASELREFEDESLWDSLYACSNTGFAARLAAGGTIDICKAVMKGELRNGFAVVRPPGHHAEPSAPRGFCWYNNVSIAARALLDDPELNCERILVVDWDIHHGNGIQAAHYGSNDVLYMSLHRNDNQFYPRSVHWGEGEPIGRNNSTYGNRNQNGEGEGRGYNINIPWSGGGMGDGDYIYAFDQVVLPVAREYNPDIILIASGFDAASGDVLGGCYVSDGGYAYLTHQLMGITPKVVAVLEGGYNMMSIALSAVGVVKALLGRPLPRLPNSLPSPEGVHDVDMVVQQLQGLGIWNTLTPRQVVTGPSALILGTHEIIRQWQISQMWDRYNLYPLFVPEEGLLPVYQRSALATPGFGSRKAPLLVILHEPATRSGPRETLGRKKVPMSLDRPQDPVTGEDHLRLPAATIVPDRQVIEALNKSAARIVEGTGSYVDDAIRMSFDVLDIHLPAPEVVQDVSQR